MSMNFDPRDIGEPCFKLGPLSLWIQGREFGASDDYWDGNWLVVVAMCESLGSRVCSQGPILHLSELHNWLQQLIALEDSLSGAAALQPMEPYLQVNVRLKDGKGELKIEITPNNLEESHTYLYPIDQSYLSGAIASIRRILEDYPVRSSSET